MFPQLIDMVYALYTTQNTLYTAIQMAKAPIVRLTLACSRVIRLCSLVCLGEPSADSVVERLMALEPPTPDIFAMLMPPIPMPKNVDLEWI